MNVFFFCLNVAPFFFVKCSSVFTIFLPPFRFRANETNVHNDMYQQCNAVLKNSTIAREVKTVKDDSAANRQNGLIHTPYG